jgi:hypothetical protein
MDFYVAGFSHLGTYIIDWKMSLLLLVDIHSFAN